MAVVQHWLPTVVILETGKPLGSVSLLYFFLCSSYSSWVSISLSILVNLQLWRINETTFNFRVVNKDFIGLFPQGPGMKVIAHAAEPGPTETFRIIRNVDNPSRVRILASNDLYIQVKLSLANWFCIN